MAGVVLFDEHDVLKSGIMGDVGYAVAQSVGAMN